MHCNDDVRVQKTGQDAEIAPRFAPNALASMNRETSNLKNEQP